MSAHAGIIVNEATNRFHPMVFRASPRPSETPEAGTVCRHKSAGHHTAGFDTMEEAERWIERQGYWPTFTLYNWCGKADVIPATIDYFPLGKQESPANPPTGGQS